MSKFCILCAISRGDWMVKSKWKVTMKFVNNLLIKIIILQDFDLQVAKVAKIAQGCQSPSNRSRFYPRSLISMRMSIRKLWMSWEGIYCWQIWRLDFNKSYPIGLSVPLTQSTSKPESSNTIRSHSYFQESWIL